MTLNPISIATKGYVCGGCPRPLAIATKGYVCFAAVIGGGGKSDNAAFLLRIKEDDEAILAVIMSAVEIIS